MRIRGSSTPAFEYSSSTPSPSSSFLSATIPMFGSEESRGKEQTLTLAFCDRLALAFASGQCLLGCLFTLPYLTFFGLERLFVEVLAALNVKSVSLDPPLRGSLFLTDLARLTTQLQTEMQKSISKTFPSDLRT
jgi:hypothetical protein